MNKVIFLDRDGVINVNKNYVHKIEDFEFIDGIFYTCRELAQLGYLLLIITNQSGINRDFYSEYDFLSLTNWMVNEFRENGIIIEKVYYCRHKATDLCNCRKPLPGLFYEAIHDFNVNVGESWMIGDNETDVVAAHKAGIKNTILFARRNVKMKNFTTAKYVTNSVDAIFDTIKKYNLTQMTSNICNFNKKSILITGGAGFIGSNTAHYLQNHYDDIRIVIFDCFRSEETFSNGNLKSFGSYINLIGYNGEVICGNLNNRSDIIRLKDYKFDFIFHFAAISDTRVFDQEIIMRTNVNSFYDIIELAIDIGAPLVYASSAATYGCLPSPQKVGHEFPENPYGFSKYIMDRIANKFIKDYPDQLIVGLRYFNVYGPREFHKNATASMVLQLGLQILCGKSPTLFFGSDQILRDFIFIDDIVQANINACSSKKSGVFNVGTGVHCSFLEVGNILQEYLKTRLSYNYVKNPYSGYQMETQADITLTKECLNFDPKYSIEEGIMQYLPEIRRIYEKYYR